MRQNKTHILVAISTLNLGGAERAMINLMKHFDRNIFKISLMIESIGPLVELVPSDVELIELGFTKKTPHLLTGSFLVSRVLNKLKPDIILTNTLGMNFFTITGRMFSRSKTKLILIEHSNDFLLKYDAFSAKILQSFIQYFYPKADHIVSVSYGLGKELCIRLPNIVKKQSTIYNPVWDEKLLEYATLPITQPINDILMSDPIILSIGRIVYEKDHITMLKALKVLHEKYKIMAQLLIIGNGDLDSLRYLINNLNLNRFVKLLGEILNPYPFFKLADLFVLSSRAEGMSIVIVEAMTLGVPVVSTDCPFGPKEVLEMGKCGLLVSVEDPVALAKCICKMLTEKQLKDNFINNGLRRARDFRAELIVKDYEKLILNVLSN